MRSLFRAGLVMIIVLSGIRRARVAARERKDLANRTHELAFRVPNGHDPAKYVATLRSGGLPARARLAGGHEDVVITIAGPADRALAQRLVSDTSKDWSVGGDPVLQSEFTVEQ